MSERRRAHADSAAPRYRARRRLEASRAARRGVPLAKADRGQYLLALPRGA